jgi:hypothetical protein
MSFSHLVKKMPNIPGQQDLQVSYIHYTNSKEVKMSGRNLGLTEAKQVHGLGSPWNPD